MRVVCWNTVSAPGPEFSAFIGFKDFAPREGEQLEFDDGRHANVPDGIYYVHRVHHIYDNGQNTFFTTVEVTDRHPGLAR